MKPSPRLTERALMHFVNMGEWGDFAAEPIDVEKAVHLDQEEGAVFITRDSISHNAAPSKRGDSKYWRLLYVYSAPPTKQYNVCLKMYFGSDGSAIYPGLKSSPKEVYLVSLEKMQWLKSLMEIASHELKPFATILNALKHRSWRPATDNWSPRFAIYVDFIKKQISELAEEYGRRRAEDRFHHDGIAKTWQTGSSIGLELLAKSSKATGVRSRREVISLERCQAINIERCSTRLPLTSRIASSWEENELKKWLAERTWRGFDAGGPVDLAFVSSMAPPEAAYSRRYRSESELKASGLWWWQEVLGLRNEVPKSLFQANWFRSAFYYEFRARQNLKGLSYWPFEVPWAWLGQLERAALYYLWPPVQGADNVFDASLLTPPGERRFNNRVEITLHADMSKSQVKEAAKKAEREHEQVAKYMPSAGAPTPADVFPMSGEPESAWRFLEVLDCSRHRLLSLKDSEMKQLERMRKHYRSDCDDVMLWDGLAV